MEKRVEELIKRGMDFVKKERVLNRKLIEAYANDDISAIEYLKELYQECSYNTDSIIIDLITKENITLPMLFDYFKKNKNDFGKEESAFYFLFQDMEYIYKSSKLTSNFEESYIAKNSITCENISILFNLYIDYLKNNKFEDKDEKTNFLESIVNYTAVCPAIRQLFRGNTELASSLCAPELHHSKSKINLDVSMISSMNLKLTAESLENTFFPMLSMNSLSEEENTRLMLPMKLGLIACLVQCEKHGIDLGIEQYTSNPITLKYLRDAKKSASEYLEKQNKLVKK